MRTYTSTEIREWIAARNLQQYGSPDFPGMQDPAPSRSAVAKPDPGRREITVTDPVPDPVPDTEPLSLPLSDDDPTDTGSEIEEFPEWQG